MAFTRNDFGQFLTTIGDYLEKYGQSSADSLNARAYEKYLKNVANSNANDLTKTAEKYDAKLQDLYNTNSQKFDNEANTQLSELKQLNQDIADEASEAQRQNRNQVQTELAQQGIRGGQAAILANRATGELNRDLQRDINKNIYSEAQNRQNARLNNYSQQTLIPLQSMSGAYGTSLSGANNALSGAQADMYRLPYLKALTEYSNSLNKNNGGQILGGVLGSLGSSLIGKGNVLSGIL